MRITFHGATQTVTGSRFLVETDGSRVLVDCGLFQGPKPLRLLNRADPPFDAKRLSAVVLTHAHLDHSGWLPVLVDRGYEGAVRCTPGTRDLLRILLPDAARLQEEDAREANEGGWSKHQPAAPLFDRAMVDRALERLVPVEFGEPFPLGDLEASLHPAGHIVGASWLALRHEGRRVVFSGDVGRPHDPLMGPPAPVGPADAIIVESTYGDRRHPDVPPLDALVTAIAPVLDRGGTVVMPTFAVGRAQLVLHLLRVAMTTGRLRPVPVFLDSPMAIAATDVFAAHAAQHRIPAEEIRALASFARFTESIDQSRAIANDTGPKVILAGSGMATGGRVLSHLSRYGDDPRHGVVLVGWQAEGTRGRAILDGAETVKIHGREVPVLAERIRVAGLSAHADHVELIDWLRTVDGVPARCFVVHGEVSSADAFRRRLWDKLRWDADVPRLGQLFRV